MKSSATFSLADIGWSKPVLDRSVVPLVVANAIVIGTAIVEHWTFADAAAAYWGQTAVIAAFGALRIRLLRDFSAEGLKFNGVPAQETPQAKTSVIVMSLSISTVFLLIYYVLFVADRDIDARSLLLGLAVFSVHHGIGFAEQVRKDRASRPLLGPMIFRPFVRFAPMQLMMFLAPFGAAPFMCMKALADIVTHTCTRRTILPKSPKFEVLSETPLAPRP